MTGISFSLPGIESKPLQDIRPCSLLAALYGTNRPTRCFFRPRDLASSDLTARPPAVSTSSRQLPSLYAWLFRIRRRVRSMMKIQATFVASPTADELLAAASMLAPPQLQENDDLLSSGSAVTDALQAFISGEYLQDFGGSVPSPAAGDSASPGAHSMIMTDRPVSQRDGDSRSAL